MTYESSDNFTVGSIQVSPQHNTMVNGEHTCRLQPKAMAVLHYLAKNNDRVISNDELLDQVWQGRVVTHSSIQKCVNALRSAFTELDGATEYVVYFSKQGYQLVFPKVENINVDKVTNKFVLRLVVMITFISIVIIGYVIYLFNPVKVTLESGEPNHIDITQFTQVKPYVSNTGREKIIEPYINSTRVAFIRDEFDSSGSETESHLFVQGNNGQQWNVSVARGRFIALSWSPSGRNLVAIDVHNENKRITGNDVKKSTEYYYTFHIYTFDFKGEKVIEKNLLSHWIGDVSSVSWWDEGILEFTASQGKQSERSRYRYSIADQNLSTLKRSTDEGKLLMSSLFNKQTVTLSLLKRTEELQFLDENQELLGRWPIPFNVISMSWTSNGTGVLLLSDDNQLSLLYNDGRLHTVDYSPMVNGRIKYARSKNKGKSIVLTVEALSVSKKSLPSDVKDDLENTLSPERFMEKGGGFIYSTARNN